MLWGSVLNVRMPGFWEGNGRGTPAQTPGRGLESGGWGRGERERGLGDRTPRFVQGQEHCPVAGAVPIPKYRLKI